MNPWRASIARIDGAGLLSCAILVAVVLGCRGIAQPWEDGFRGMNGGAYTGNFIRNHLTLGLGVTRGCSVSIVEPLDPPVLHYYLNHPSTFTLLVLVPCALLGCSELVIRGAALALFLLALPALFLIARRFVSSRRAGAVVLLFASTPMVAYYGPMAIPDGSIVAATLWLVWAFLRLAEAPARARRLALGILWIVTCLLDWTGLFAGLVLLALVPLSSDPRRMLRIVLGLGVLTIVPLSLVLAHSAWAMHGVTPALRAYRELFGNAGTPVVLTELAAVKAGHLWSWVGWPCLALAAVGTGRAIFGGSATRRAFAAAVILTLPGIANTLVFRSHAVIHDFWMLHAMPGIALMAGLGLPGRAAGRLPSAIRRAWIEGVGGVALAATATLGVITTVKAVDANETTFHRDIGDLFNSRFGAGDVIATSVNLRLESYYTNACLVGPIERQGQAREVMTRYASLLKAGHTIAFVLPASAHDSSLARFLSRTTTRDALGKFLVYGVRANP